MRGPGPRRPFRSSGSETRPLEGVRILVPREGRAGDAAAEAVRSRGGVPVTAALVDVAAPLDPTPLDAARAALAAGDYEWLVVTSARAVAAIAATPMPDLAGARIASVGAATSVAVERVGWPVAFAPAGESSARGLVREWPEEGAGRVLWPRSSAAAPTVREGLEELGWRVDDPIAYRPVTRALPAAVREALRTGGIGLVLVTSGAIARRVAEELAGADRLPTIVTIGPATTRAALAAGLEVAAEAADRSIDAMLDAAGEVRR